MNLRFWRKTTVEQTIAPLIVCAKFMGLCTFSFPAKQYKRSAIGMILFFAIFSYDVCKVLLTLIHWDGFSSKFDSKIFWVVSFILTLSSNFITVMIFIICFCMRESFFALIVLFRRFDEAISAVATINHTKHFTLVYVAGSLKALYLFASLSRSDDILRDLVEYSSILVTVELFVMFSFLLLERIKIINDVLSRIDKLEFSSERDVMTKLEVVFPCIEQLSALSHQINKSLGTQTLFIIISQFLIGVVCVFVCIYSLIGLNFSLLLVLRYIYYAIYVNYNILQICVLGSLINTEMLKVSKFRRKIISRNVSHKNVLDVNLDFTRLGCGFFEFDMRLLQKIVATQALYFVVMTQFQKMINSEVSV